MSYTVVKIKSSYKDTITLLFKELIGFDIEVIEKTDYLIFKHNYENIKDIESIILSLSNDMINVFCYTTIVKDALDELNLVKDLFNKYNTGFYTLKDLLINEINNINKKEAFDLIVRGSRINSDFINEYLKYDLNVSKAAKKMFLHRNTLIYNLDKLKETSGFDLRCFKDAYIIYSLIK